MVGAGNLARPPRQHAFTALDIRQEDALSLLEVPGDLPRARQDPGDEGLETVRDETDGDRRAEDVVQIPFGGIKIGCRRA